MRPFTERVDPSARSKAEDSSRVNRRLNHIIPNDYRAGLCRAVAAILTDAQLLGHRPAAATSSIRRSDRLSRAHPGGLTMRNLLRSKSLWMVGGALVIGLGVAAARAMRFDIDFDPWSDDLLGV